MYSIYKHVNKTNGKVYIGITKQKPETRWGVNGVNYKNSPRFWSAIQHYGWDNFEHIVIRTDLTHDEACQMEKDLIKVYNAQNPDYGYNILEGGIATVLPLEVRQKMSQAMMGNKNGLGKPCSEEKKRKISEAQKGRKLTEEHKQKLSEAHKGKTHIITEETKQKISDAAKKKPVYCPETDTIYPSIQQCARELGLAATNICAVCKGKHKTHHGYHFEYYTDTIKA